MPSLAVLRDLASRREDVPDITGAGFLNRPSQDCL